MLKKSTVPEFAAVLTLSVFSLLALLVPCSAETDSLQEQVRALNGRIDQIVERRKEISDKIANTWKFGSEHAQKFNYLNQFDYEIDSILNKQESGKSGLRDSDSQSVKLKELQKKRELLLNTPVVINGKEYQSFSQLLDAIVKANTDHILLRENYNTLTRQLDDLGRERDMLIAQARGQVQQNLQLENYNRAVEQLREELDIIQTLVDNKEIWLIDDLSVVAMTSSSFFPNFPRQEAIDAITCKYLADLHTTPGKKFNQQELAEKIKQAQSGSKKIKEIIRHRIIPEKTLKINELQARINSLRPEMEIEGNWVIIIGTENFPIINISNRGAEGYEAVITKVGQLDHFKPGGVLFVVNRTEANIYVGTEYSFTESGEKTALPLRLEVNPGGKSLRYRSDELLTLQRCD